MTRLSVDSHSVVFIAALTGVEPSQVMRYAKGQRTAARMRALVMLVTWLVCGAIVVGGLYALILLGWAVFAPEPINMQLPTI